MTALSIPAVYGVNKYLWQKIQDAGIITADDQASQYGGFVPIIPVQEEPQFLTAMDATPGYNSSPYIIYNWYSGPIDPVSWYKQSEFLVYAINSLDQVKLRQLFLLTTNIFKRWDESAEAVNRYINQTTTTTTSGTPDGQTPPPPSTAFNFSPEYRAYHYHSISVVSSHAGIPQTEGENSPMVATVTLRVHYSNTNNDIAL